MKKKITTRVLAILLFCTFLACGLYKPPMAPEYFSPMEVKDLVVTTEDARVLVNWKASTEDRRKEKLKFIDGYILERKGPIRNSERKSDAEYQELKFLPDQHLLIEEKLKEEAVNSGQISRKVKAGEEYYVFSFADSDLEKGATYFYKVTPVNQGGVKGQVKQIVVVEFQGLNSKVIFIEAEAEELVEE